MTGADIHTLHAAGGLLAAWASVLTDEQLETLAGISDRLRAHGEAAEISPEERVAIEAAAARMEAARQACGAVVHLTLRRAA